MASRIIGLVFCATLLTSLVLAAASTRSMETFLRRKVDQKFPALLASMSERLDIWYAQRKLDIETFSRSEIIRGDIAALGSPTAGEAARRDVRAYLAYVLDRFPQYGALFLLGPDGRHLLWVGEEIELPAGFRDKLADVASSSLSGIHRAGRTRIQAASSAVLDARHRRLGSVHALLRLSALDELLISDRLGPSGQAFLVGPDGAYLTPVRGRSAGTRHSRPRPELGEPPEVMEYLNEAAEPVIGASMQLQRFGWTLAVEESYAEAFKPAQVALWQIFGINLIITLVFSGIAYWVAQSIVRPIRALSAAARRIADGESDVMIEGSSSDDEIRLLTRSFNLMLSRLRRNRAELQESRTKVKEANARLRGQNEELQRMNETLERLSITDGLTRLYNHRFFQEQLTREIARVERERRELTLILIDIDNFKGLNDRFGHSAGDEVLCAIARVMTTMVRDSDVLARYGGEEFTVLPNDTDIAGAVGLAEKIRIAIAETDIEIEDGGDLATQRVTVSIGVASYSGDRKAFFNDADRALYRAKASGKDCVVAAGSDEER